MRNLLKFILKILAKQTMTRYKPTVVGITGSVGKTTAKESVYTVLSRRFWVRKNEENYNNELGVPMAVLGINPDNFHSFSSKLLAMSSSVWLAYGWPKQKYPDFLVLELAADKPGDIKYLVDMIRPEIGVMTAVGEVPVHVEFYASPQEVAKEKAYLIDQLPKENGLAVLNYDDQTVLDMKDYFNGRVMTFGFSNLADIWASDISYFAIDDNRNIGGLSFKINHGSTFIPVRMKKLAGQHQIYGILAAAATGLHFGMNLVYISGALEGIDLPHGRMNLLPGIKNSVIIDDTYNASPLSMHAALDALRDFSNARQKLGRRGRKIAILGDMKELGRFEVEAHRAIGNLAAERCDLLVTVGNAARFIADSAANQMAKGNILILTTSDEAKIKVQEIIEEEDVILIKGSRAMKMEKIVEEIALI